MAYEGLVQEIGVNCQYYDGLNVTIEFVDPVREGSRVDGALIDFKPKSLRSLGEPTKRVDL